MNIFKPLNLLYLTMRRINFFLKKSIHFIIFTIIIVCKDLFLLYPKSKLNFIAIFSILFLVKNSHLLFFQILTIFDLILFFLCLFNFIILKL
jgi:hypothetical protein